MLLLTEYKVISLLIWIIFLVYFVLEVFLGLYLLKAVNLVRHINSCGNFPHKNSKHKQLAENEKSDLHIFMFHRVIWKLVASAEDGSKYALCC